MVPHEVDRLETVGFPVRSLRSYSAHDVRQSQVKGSQALETYVYLGAQPFKENRGDARKLRPFGDRRDDLVTVTSAQR